MWAQEDDLNLMIGAFVSPKQSVFGKGKQKQSITEEKTLLAEDYWRYPV